MKFRWRECEHCGQLYNATTETQRFCSRSCARTRDQMLRNVDASLIDELMCAIRCEVEKVLKK